MGSKTGKRAIYYHTNWSTYGRNYQVKDLPIDHLTDVAYAFFNLANEGGDKWVIKSGDSYADFEKHFVDGVPPADTWEQPGSEKGNFNQFKKLKKAGKEFSMTLSIGGWTWSKDFSNAVASDASRQSLCSSIIVLFQKYPLFTGVSLDWEYLSGDMNNYGNVGNSVRSADPQNFAEFLKLLRKSFQENGWDKYTISYCCTAATEKVQYKVEDIHPLVDEMHIMTYDFHDGNWGEIKSAHMANLRKSSHGKYSVEEAVDFYLGKGVPSHKLFIGGTLYSRGFANTDDIGKQARGGSPDMSWEAGVCDYKTLPRPGAEEKWDDEAKATYSYDAAKKIINSYDSVQSIICKCNYILEKDLGGIIMWESSGDYPYEHPRSIMRAIAENLTHRRDENPSIPSTPLPVPKPVPKPEFPGIGDCPKAGNILEIMKRKLKATIDSIELKNLM